MPSLATARPRGAVAHLTAVHPPDDVRIFAKECRTLAAAGYDVHLVAPGAEDSVVDGVRFHSVRRAGANRLVRMTVTVAGIHRIARRLDADVYHFHDPELIPVGLLLRWRGKEVIYDSHEHLPEQVLTKPWIPGWLRRPLAGALDLVERWAAGRVYAVFTAEPYVERRFARVATRTVCVSNYPPVEEFAETAPPLAQRPRATVYVGSITELRGVREMLRAIALTDATLLLAGRFNPAALEGELAAEPGWAQVEVLGQVGRDELPSLLARARVGLVVLRRIPNYLQANPTKMFEYMAAGIPVIASDFPAWRRIVDAHECGMCVDPAEPHDIARTIVRLLDDPELARRMGENGRRAATRHYSWQTEQAKLISLYEDLAPRSVSR